MPIVHDRSVASSSRACAVAAWVNAQPAPSPRYTGSPSTPSTHC